jgi:hypothetical protein
MGNKTIMGGIGGVWGNRSKDVIKPFCRTCDIEALSVGKIERANRTRTPSKLETREQLPIFAFLLIGLIIMLLPVNQWGVFIGMGIIILTAIFTVFKVNSKK